MEERLITLTTDGYDAIVEAYAIHPKTKEVVLLSLIGQPDAVKALRACLSIGIEVRLTGQPYIRWPKEPDTFYTVIQKRCASGAQAVLWLPQHGTSVGVQHDTRAFLIERDREPPTLPKNFLHILDRMLPCPLLPEWAAGLWSAALTHAWVVPMDCYNCTVWEVLPKTDEIIAWINQYLMTEQPQPLEEEVSSVGMSA